MLAQTISTQDGRVVLEIVVLPKISAEGTLTADVNVMVISGNADLLDCEQRRASVNAGQSGTVWAEGESCSEAVLGERPQQFAAAMNEADEILIVGLPPEEGGIPPTQFPEQDDLFQIEESQSQQDTSSTTLQ
jgi:hypothetical protein